MALTMYEKIMYMPLFHGATVEQISYFLEKTAVNICNYSDGDVIVAEDSYVDRVRCLIDGCIRIRYCFHNIVFEESDCSNRIIGYDRLFGLDVEQRARVLADGKVAIMEFSKEDYFKFLHYDNIFLLNFLNSLSLRGQKGVQAIKHYPGASLGEIIARTIIMLTEKTSFDLTISGSIFQIAKIANLPEQVVEMELQHLVSLGVIVLTPDSIRIPDREHFLKTLSLIEP